MNVPAPVLPRLSALSLALVASLASAAEAPPKPADESAEDSAQRLDTVVVTASSVAGAPRTNWQTLQKSTVIDMKDILQQQPGLSVSGGTGASQQLYLRGLGENELTFTVDNAGNNSQSFHHQSRFLFDPAMLKSIQIDKGAGAASAGIGVTAGAIRMTTVDPDDLLEAGRDFGARVGVGVHSNAGNSHTLAGYGRFGGGFDALLLGNWINQRDYRDGHGNRVPHSAIEQEAFLAKLGWNPAAGHRLVLSQRRELHRGYRPLRLNVLGLRGLPSFDSDLRQDTTNLEYKGVDLGFIDSLEANLFHSDMDDRKSANGPMPTSGFASQLPAHSRSEIHATGGNIGFTSLLGAHRLKYGYNLRKESIGNRAATAGRHREDKTDAGLYVEGIWGLRPVTLTTGLRYDHFSMENNSRQRRDGAVLNPSLGLIWDINRELSLSAGIAQASRSPRLYEAYILGLPWGDGYKLAEDIKPERALSREIGLEWRRGGLALSGSIYKQTIRDYLGGVYDAPTDTTIQSNIGRLENPGYEVAAAWRAGGLNARLAMSHSKPRVNGLYRQSTLDSVPTGRQWNGGLSYRFAGLGLEAGWRGLFFQRLDVAVQDDAGRVTGHAHKPGYGANDLYLNWQPLHNDRFNLNFSVNNVGDKAYYSQTNFCLGNNESTCLAEAGRDYRLSLNYRF